jgi:hypothetical protein
MGIKEQMLDTKFEKGGKFWYITGNWETLKMSKT